MEGAYINRKLGTGNQEPGTRNRESGTGNQEPGTNLTLMICSDVMEINNQDGRTRHMLV